MRVVQYLFTFFLALVSATILENGQERKNPYPGQVSKINLDNSWKSYQPDASEISYKGRWDSKHVSCMSMLHLFPESPFHLILTIARVVVCLTLPPVNTSS